MTTSGGKKTGRERQRITRTACEPCRDKRAKCDGQKPCGRCQSRGLECHFIQRAWASKRSLQDEAISLREKLHRRDRVIEALSIPGTGDEVIRMLREGGTTDKVFEKLGGGFRITPDDDGGMRIDTEGHGNCVGPCECENCWSPSTTNTNLMSNASQEQSPFSFAENGNFADDPPPQQHPAILQPATTSDQHHQSAAMQAIPWATQEPTSFGNMLDSTTPMNSNIDSRSTVIDPLLWPPVTGSETLGQPYMNSWTGLMGDAPPDSNKAAPFSCTA